MPLIIDSTPDCVTHTEGAKPADDIADFILQANYQDCAGFMTFGPGTTYGDEGAGAATSYYVLTWVGIVVMVVVLLYWVIYEHRLYMTYSLRHPLGGPPDDVPPQPGVTR